MSAAAADYTSLKGKTSDFSLTNMTYGECVSSAELRNSPGRCQRAPGPVSRRPAGNTLLPKQRKLRERISGTRLLLPSFKGPEDPPTLQEYSQLQG